MIAHELSLEQLASSQELAAANAAIFPNESADYRAARNALLAEEIELRRQIERVAASRRALPPGGEPADGYRFLNATKAVTLAELFGDKETLVIYSMMYGPQRARPCPMCTAFVSAFNATARNLSQRVSVVVTARSPIERILSFAEERNWKDMPFVSDSSGDYTRAYVSREDADSPALNVFTRRDGRIRHFWANELFRIKPDPGQDPRLVPEVDALWTLLDLTPEGRDPKWYPKLEYST
jgi:predicted dithiol-disulfide oxidoreductase (DUF899 family)